MRCGDESAPNQRTLAKQFVMRGGGSGPCRVWGDPAALVDLITQRELHARVGKHTRPTRRKPTW